MPYHIKKFGSRFKVVDDKGREYSKQGLTKAKARAQQKALYATAFHGSGFCCYSDDDGHHVLLEGGGIFSDVFAKAKRIASAAVSSVTNRVKDVSLGIRDDYPPDVRKVLAQYGEGTVTDLLIRREPIQSFINKALNFISLGTWNKARKELNYDKLYHLSLIATLQMPDGSQARLMVEKNEVINITPNFSMRGAMEMITVPVPCCITFRQMMDKAQQLQGARFFRYDAFTNNCQMFIMSILDANDLTTSEVKAFVLQDVDSLLRKVPTYVSPFARALTNVAGLFNVALKGRGACCGECAPIGGCTKCEKCGGGEPTVVMPADAYLAEHKKLIALLNDIAKRAKGEADEQAAEVRARRKGGLKGGAGAEGFREALATTGLDAPPTDPYAIKVGENSWEIVSKPTDVVTFDEAKYNQMLSRGLSREAYEAKQAKKRTPGKSYEDYRKSLEEVSRARATTNQSAVERAGKQAQRQQDILDYYKEYVRLNPHLENVLCYSSPEGDAVPGGIEIPKYQCDANNKARQRKEYGSTFFGKINQALTDVADWAVDNIGSKLPGVGKYVAEAYKAFAPPTSKFSGGSKAQWIQEVVKHMKRGSFTKQAKRAGLDPEAFAKHVISHPKDFTATTRKRAQFVVNILGRKVGGCGTCGGEPNPAFAKQLAAVELAPDVYLARVRTLAKKAGYDPAEVGFAPAPHKIQVRGRKAGRVGYRDFIIWSHLEAEGKVPKGTADKKRSTFHKSHSAIKGDWKADKYSPNNLALHLLW